MTKLLLTPLEASAEAYVPEEIDLRDNPQTGLPRLAKDAKAVELIEHAVRRMPTQHHLFNMDARGMRAIPDKSVHLVVTSPPYWT